MEMGKGEVALDMGIHGPKTVGAFCSVPEPVQVTVRLVLFCEIPIVTQLTVTVKLQDWATPAALLATQETSVAPVGKRLPEGGLVASVKFELHSVT